MKETESPRQVKIHRVLERSASYLTADFWEKLFVPLRGALIARISRSFPKLTHEDAEDIADETILRLYKYYDVPSLEAKTEEQRIKSFYAFVGKTLYSAISDSMQRGLMKKAVLNGQESSESIKRAPTVPLDRITAAFHDLKPESQRLLQYRIIDGLAYSAIQQRLAEEGEVLSVDAVKMRTLRALTDLRRALNKLG
jgi:DNA-directed RNA polymerase specialized sigma24 family protein